MHLDLSPDSGSFNIGPENVWESQHNETASPLISFQKSFNAYCSNLTWTAFYKSQLIEVIKVILYNFRVMQHFRKIDFLLSYTVLLIASTVVMCWDYLMKMEAKPVANSNGVQIIIFFWAKQTLVPITFLCLSFGFIFSPDRWIFCIALNFSVKLIRRNIFPYLIQL